MESSAETENLAAGGPGSGGLVQVERPGLSDAHESGAAPSDGRGKKAGGGKLEEVRELRSFLQGESESPVTISTFVDESGKFRDHKVICIGCVAAFNQHVDDFARKWGSLLARNGMENFHTTKALRHHVALGDKNPAMGLGNRIEALLPFIACIRENLEVAVGCWVDVKIFRSLPQHFFQVYGRDPSYMAFMRTLMQAASFTPEGDGMVLVCDEDEETAWEFYRLYRRLKQLNPEVRKRLGAISFADDAQVFAIQAADLVASIVRIDALSRRAKQRNGYRPLFKALTAEPQKAERIWYVGIAKGDKDALLKTAEAATDNLKKRKLIP